MFTPNTFIDAVQNAKKQVVEFTVSDKAIKQNILDTIEAQTEFVKTASNNTIEITKLVVAQVGKADYSKFFAFTK